MSCLYYYKLQSEFPCDETVGCLTKAQVDSNFYQLKKDDISGATYDNETMSINIIRNDGDIINIDLTGIQDKYNEAIREAVSGFTPQTLDIQLEGELNDEGVLSLRWTDSLGDHVTEISGFLTEAVLKHDSTLKGDGSNAKPVGIANTEKTGQFKACLGVVEELPSNPNVGDRWISSQTSSSFGRLYNKQGLYLVKVALKQEESVWRVPTLEDWNKLLNYADACNDEISGDEIGVYQGNVCGKMLKTIPYWDGNDNLDKYKFSAVPAGYMLNGQLTGDETECRFWTDTTYQGNKNFIKGFSYNKDNCLQDAETDNGWYSIRLVRDIDDTLGEDNANILGHRYGTISIGDIKQAWTTTNLAYNPGLPYCEQYAYPFENLITKRYTINYYNGKYWEKRELEKGDKVTVTQGNMIVEYICTEPNPNMQYLITGNVYKADGENARLVLDAGWY